MFGLRQKLAFGFGGLLAMLLIVSGSGIIVLADYRSALDRFFYENWRSVEDGQHVIEGLAALDSLVKNLPAAPTAAELAAANRDAALPLAAVDANLDAENHNITLDGERELAAKLTLAWAGQSLDHKAVTPDGYRTVFKKLLDASTSPASRQAATASLARMSPTVKANAQTIVDLNLANMRPVAGRAKRMANKATLLMVALAVAGVALAVVFTLLVARSILRPLTTIIRSIREIEAGNMDLVVQVRSRDELRTLAEAFNSMAAKLREYRRTNRAKFIRTQQTTQLAVNSLPDAVAVTGPDGTIELSNDAARLLFSLNPGENVTQAGDRRLVELYREVLKSARPSQPRGYESAVEVYDKGGQLRFFLPHAVPISEGDGRLIGVTLVLADVTNLRKLDEMKSGLLSVVSHELKTPLTSIRMAVHLLLEERVGPLTPKQAELVTAAREDSDRLEKIIADLLDMGRLESGHANLDLRPERVEKVIDVCVQPLLAMYHDRGITLDVDTGGADGVNVLIDPTRINHVLTNLLTNAAKFTAPGGNVRITADQNGDFVKFSVSDTGIGIPEEHRAHVFDRFFRVPNAPRTAGVGLGLAIARDIVRAHGGDIELASEQGRGSTFTFTLRTAAVTAPMPSAAVETDGPVANRSTESVLQ